MVLKFESSLYAEKSDVLIRLFYLKKNTNFRFIAEKAVFSNLRLKITIEAYKRRRQRMDIEVSCMQMVHTKSPIVGLDTFPYIIFH